MPMSTVYTTATLDEKTRKDLIKVLADMRDPRASAAFAKAFNEYEAGRNDEDVKFSAQAVNSMAKQGKLTDQGVIDALWNCFSKFQASKTKSINLVTDLHDAVLAVKSPSYGPKAVEKLSAPVDPKVPDQSLDQIQFWQLTSIQVISDLKYAAGVHALVTVVVNPSKSDLRATANAALMRMPKEAEPVLIAALKGTDPEFAKYSAMYDDKGYIAVVADSVSWLSRPAGKAAILEALAAADNDQNRTILAQCLVHYPPDPGLEKAFLDAYAKIPPTAGIALLNGGNAHGALTQASAQFYDSHLTDWLVKEIATAKGEAADEMQLFALDAAIKLMQGSQLNPVRDQVNKEGTELEKNKYKQAAQVVQKCGADVNCYVKVLDDPIPSSPPTAAETAVKAAWMAAEYGVGTRRPVGARRQGREGPAARGEARARRGDRLSRAARGPGRRRQAGQARRRGPRDGGQEPAHGRRRRRESRAAPPRPRDALNARCRRPRRFCAVILSEAKDPRPWSAARHGQHIRDPARGHPGTARRKELRVGGGWAAHRPILRRRLRAPRRPRVERSRAHRIRERYTLFDLRSTNGTALVRKGGERMSLDDANGREALLESGDVIELGSGDRLVTMSVTMAPDPEDARVVAVRRIEEVEPATTTFEKDGRLRMIYEAQKKIGAAGDLNLVLEAISDATFELVPKATHVTLILRDDDEESGKATAVSGYIPVMTRVRGQAGPQGPIPVTRSVFRKVVSERAAVVAADAAEVGQSESLMGASIRSTLGVPLWNGEEILGVLQIDNRVTAGVFTSADLEVMAVLAHNASLAVANARLVMRLRSAEDRLKKENAFLKGREESRRTGGRGGQPEIIGQSAAIKSLIAQLDKVLDTRVTVLVDGETGVGKELVAASVHYRSRRRDKLFVGQNCAAMPENLLESELFGHKKGAFTGAHEEKKGLFEIADEGTLFLDEVTEMSLSLQSKLLRVLQEGEIRPIGATHEKRVNVRIVAATNRTLEKEVAEGRFREDLYYRLKVFPLRVPPLRERREDVPLLAVHFLARYTAELGKPAGGFSQQAMELLQGYDWPGNVRELQNEVQRLVIQVDPGGFITPDLLSPRVRQVEGVIERVKPTKGTLKETMDQLERWILIEALREHKNNKTVAARALGITREGLHKKLRGFGL